MQVGLPVLLSHAEARLEPGLSCEILGGRMSGDNVEIVRSIYRAVGTRDDVTPFELYAPDVESDVGEQWMGLGVGPVFHGHEGVRAFCVRPQELIDFGDRGFLRGEFSAAGARSGIEIAESYFQLFHTRDGLVTREQMRLDETQALEAVGLREYPVSRENVEVVRAFTEPFNARDIEAKIAICHPDIEYHSTFSAVGGETYHGHDGLRSWHRDFEETWAGEIRSEPEAFFDLGEDTLMFTVLRGRGRHSGVQVALPAAIVMRSRDGLLVYIKGYAHREDALRDLGVSEEALEALEPIAP